MAMATQKQGRMPKVNKTQLAKDAGVSRRSLYYIPKQCHKDEAFKTEIEQVMVEHTAYGHKRIAIELKRDKKRILRVMNIYGLTPAISRKNPPQKTADQNKGAVPYENIFKRLCPIRANAVWSGDFTYLRWQQTWLYLATIIDLFTREIVGFSLSRWHNKELVLKALNEAVKNSEAVPQYFHSDQGSEYDSGEYTNHLKRLGVTISMSEKASPWQNGHKESFYSHYKLELGDLNRHQSAGELYEALCIQMHYYNTKRIHTALKMPPRAFRVLQETKYCRHVVQKSGA